MRERGGILSTNRPQIRRCRVLPNIVGPSETGVVLFDSRLSKEHKASPISVFLVIVRDILEKNRGQGRIDEGGDTRRFRARVRE